MSTTATTATRTSLSLAPEDIKVGDYIGVLHASVQYPTFNWHGDLKADVSDEECVRISYLPYDGGVPLRVESMSLPFVLVKLPGRHCETLDLRLCRIARLDKDYAKRAWKELAKPFKRSKKKRK